MGIEVQHRNWAVVAVQRAQQRQRDGVVAAERDQLCAAVAQLVGGLLDGGDGLGDIERVDRNVAGVGHLLHGERLDVQPRVIGPQQLGRGPDMARTEPGAGPVGDARVERDADHGDVGVWHLVDAGQTGEGGGSGVARHPRPPGKPAVGRIGMSGIYGFPAIAREPTATSGQLYPQVDPPAPTASGP